VPTRRLRIHARFGADDAVATAAAPFAALRRELELPDRFPPDAQAEADATAASGLAAADPAAGRMDLTDIPFVTVDPPGSKDLDQAAHLERRGTGYRLRYAIADVAALVRPDGPLAAETRRRGESVYLPDGTVPLHPTVLSEGAASLLPDQVRPAVVWTIDLDSRGEPVRVDIRRSVVRSRAQLTYPGLQADLDAGRAPDAVALLAEVGLLRAARAAERGAIALDLPEQDVVRAADGWQLTLRAPLPVENHNAELSLLTGICAARLMLDGRVGLLRTLPPAEDGAVAGLRRGAEALGVPWPSGSTVGQVIAGVDASTARGAAFRELATALLRGAGYAAFDGAPPEQPVHAAVGLPYAHVTAPLRRLADRYATEVCLALHAASPVPDWALAALPGLPAVMTGSGRRAGTAERAAVDLVEALLLANRVGERFGAAVVQVGRTDGTVVLVEPPVRARCDGLDTAQLGERVEVTLTEADPVQRRVRFAVAGAVVSGSAT
jgi:exoribonuclease R